VDGDHAVVALPAWVRNSRGVRTAQPAAKAVGPTLSRGRSDSSPRQYAPGGPNVLDVTEQGRDPDRYSANAGPSAATCSAVIG
jgi:hypothetical protein